MKNSHKKNINIGYNTNYKKNYPLSPMNQLQIILWYLPWFGSNMPNNSLQFNILLS